MPGEVCGLCGKPYVEQSSSQRARGSERGKRCGSYGTLGCGGPHPPRRKAGYPRYVVRKFPSVGTAAFTGRVQNTRFGSIPGCQRQSFSVAACRIGNTFCARFQRGSIAQSVEQRPFKALVLGSSPSRPKMHFRVPRFQGNPSQSCSSTDQGSRREA